MLLLLGAALLLAQDPGGPSSQEIELTSPTCRFQLPRRYLEAPPDGETRTFRRTVGPIEGDLILRIRPGARSFPQPEGEATIEAARPLLPAGRGLAETPGRIEWKGFILPVAHLRGEVDRIVIVERQVAVPLQGRALILSLSGSEHLERMADEDFTAIVKSIRGPSDWLTPEQRQKVRTGRRYSMAGAGLWGLYLGAWLAFWRLDAQRHGLPRTLLLGGVALLFALDTIVTSDLWPLLGTMLVSPFLARRARSIVD